jgi:uncharacterized protein (DUF1501 family)
MNHANFSRRRFLGNLLAVAGGSAVPFTLNLAAMGTAAAEGATDYKALVCLYLDGGNDSFNTVLPTDPTSWNEYVRIRTTTDTNSIVLPSVTAAYRPLLPIAPINSQGRTFALQSSMQPIKDLFDAGRMAIIANVGTLAQPTTKAQYLAGSVPLPPKLFSHNDQKAIWQSLQPEGTQGIGWGGRLADMMASANSSSTFASMSTAGNALFLSGRTVQSVQINGNVVPAIRNLNGTLFGSSPGNNSFRNIIAGDYSDLFQKEHANVVRNAIDNQATLSTAILPAGAGGVPDPSNYVDPITGLSAPNPLALQLQTVARLIGGRSALGAKRQVFYVSLSGFDTHDNQRPTQSTLLAQLSHAMAYFDTVLGSLQGTNMRQQVTLFTASDFGRTFTSNGDGTDHGWGAHHFVMGGAVKGKDIYGTMPVTGLGHDLDIGSGSLLPTTSVDQFGATLATWFGLTATQITDVFPNIVNFSNRNLGFMA